jgi:hypothetical protein
LCNYEHNMIVWRSPFIPFFYKTLTTSLAA